MPRLNSNSSESFLKNISLPDIARNVLSDGDTLSSPEIWKRGSHLKRGKTVATPVSTITANLTRDIDRNGPDSDFERIDDPDNTRNVRFRIKPQKLNDVKKRMMLEIKTRSEEKTVRPSGPKPMLKPAARPAPKRELKPLARRASVGIKITLFSQIKDLIVQKADDLAMIGEIGPSSKKLGKGWPEANCEKWLQMEIAIALMRSGKWNVGIEVKKRDFKIQDKGSGNVFNIELKEYLHRPGYNPHVQIRNALSRDFEKISRHNSMNAENLLLLFLSHEDQEYYTKVREMINQLIAKYKYKIEKEDHVMGRYEILWIVP